MIDNNTLLLLLGLLLIYAFLNKDSSEHLTNLENLEKKKEYELEEVRKITEEVIHPKPFTECGPKFNNKQCNENEACHNSGYCIHNTHNIWYTDNIFDREYAAFDGKFTNQSERFYISDKEYLDAVPRQCGPMAGGKTCLYNVNENLKEFCTNEGFCRSNGWAKINNYWQLYNKDTLINRNYNEPSDVAKITKQIESDSSEKILKSLLIV